MSETHQERSRLVNEYKTQLRGLQKSLKKKKLPQKQRDDLEQQIEELERKYESDLKEFDALHGVEAASKKKPTLEEPSTNSEPHSPEPHLEDPSSLTTRNWGGLSKKELEECCVQRGLSRKGAKEQLISRLTVWSVSHGQVPQQSADSEANEIHYETFNPVNVVVNSGAKKDEFREKRKKLWKRRSAGPAREGPRESDESSDSDDSDDSDDHSSEAKPPTTTKGKRMGEQPDSDAEVDSATLQKQRKREAVVASVLGRILQKYKSGVKLNEIDDKLKEFKVANFTPQLLGYASLEEWIQGQPRSLLTYKAKTQMILPSVVGAMPDSDSSDDDDDESSE